MDVGGTITDATATAVMGITAGELTSVATNKATAKAMTATDTIGTDATGRFLSKLTIIQQCKTLVKFGGVLVFVKAFENYRHALDVYEHRIESGAEQSPSRTIYFASSRPCGAVCDSLFRPWPQLETSLPGRMSQNRARPRGGQMVDRPYRLARS